jgi:hypothetical protein
VNISLIVRPLVHSDVIINLLRDVAATVGRRDDDVIRIEIKSLLHRLIAVVLPHKTARKMKIVSNFAADLFIRSEIEKGEINSELRIDGLNYSQDFCDLFAAIKKSLIK